MGRSRSRSRSPRRSKYTKTHRSRSRSRDRNLSHHDTDDRGRSSGDSRGEGDSRGWKPTPGSLTVDQDEMFSSAPRGGSRAGGGGYPGRGGYGGGGYGGASSGGRRSNDRPAPPLYSVQRGCFTSRYWMMQGYGIFVRMEGFKDGLVHVSQLKEERVEDPHEVVSVGQMVYVKVTEINEQGKISLSMKLVNQDDGRDLDLDHYEAMQSAHRGKGGGGARKPITLDENQTIGMWTKNEQFDGKKWDIIDDDAEADIMRQVEEQQAWAALERARAKEARRTQRDEEKRLQKLEKKERKEKKDKKEKKENKEKKEHKHKKNKKEKRR